MVSGKQWSECYADPRWPASERFKKGVRQGPGECVLILSLSGI